MQNYLVTSNLIYTYFNNLNNGTLCEQLNTLDMQELIDSIDRLLSMRLDNDEVSNSITTQFHALMLHSEPFRNTYIQLSNMYTDEVNYTDNLQVNQNTVDVLYNLTTESTYTKDYSVLGSLESEDGFIVLLRNAILTDASECTDKRIQNYITQIETYNNSATDSITSLINSLI